MTLKQYLILSVILLITSAAEAETIDVSCVYETTKLNQPIIEKNSQHDIHAAKPIKWYFWRTNTMVEVSNEEQSFGEKWLVNDEKQVFYQALYHDKKFLLDFQPADLELLGKKSNWNVRSTIFPQKLLKHLNKKAVRHYNQYKKTRYEGEIAGIGYKIDWLPEFNLPFRIEKKTSDETLVIELKEIYSLNETPYKQPLTEKYDDMDYADIGDNESHPIVAQLQNNSGIEYPHQH